MAKPQKGGRQRKNRGDEILKPLSAAQTNPQPSLQALLCGLKTISALRCSWLSHAGQTKQHRIARG